MSPAGDDGSEVARDRRAIFWCAAGFALVGVAGLELVPAGRWIWITLIIVALTAIPQAFPSTRRPKNRRRR
jgi:hypothetical protein